MGLLKYDKSSLFHSIRQMYPIYIFRTTTRQLDWLTTVQEKYCDVSHQVVELCVPHLKSASSVVVVGLLNPTGS